MLHLWPFTNYKWLFHWLFQWDWTFHKWDFYVLISGISGHRCAHCLLWTLPKLRPHKATKSYHVHICNIQWDEMTLILHTNAHTHTYIYIYIFECKSTCKHTKETKISHRLRRLNMIVIIYMYIYICIYICIYIYVFIYICIYIYISHAKV